MLPLLTAPCQCEERSDAAIRIPIEESKIYTPQYPLSTFRVFHTPSVWLRS